MNDSTETNLFFIRFINFFAAGESFERAFLPLDTNIIK